MDERMSGVPWDKLLGHYVPYDAKIIDVDEPTGEEYYAELDKTDGLCKHKKRKGACSKCYKAELKKKGLST